MQKNCKIFFLTFYHISSIYKFVGMSINSIIIFTLFSGCNFFLKNPTKNILIKTSEYQIKNNNLNNIKSYRHIFRKGEKFDKLLNTSGVNISDILDLIKTDSDLNNCQIGQQISWKVNQFGKLLQLKWKISKIQIKIYEKNNNRFLISNIFKKDFLIKKTVLIKKKSNFFHGALKIGLNQSEIKNVIQAMQWQIDFHKLKIGSYFNLVFLHKFSDNTNVLLGVKLNNSGKQYYSIRAFNGNFYNLNGIGKKNDFINFTYLKKYRISSKFNLHRLHPITHKISQHLGVDFAMPEGTPVLSTISGKIIKAHFNKIAGFYITLKNNEQYTTRYMHLKKILVKLGEKVKKGQKIALSGNTGRTTGPHLHYELWINNRPVNPINKEIIFFQKLTEKEKKIFLKESKKVIQNLK